MQYLNDDMDELVRRAAENYPLDTSGANWDKVKNSMQQPVESSKKGIKWLWFIPLAIFWISNTFIAYRQGYGDGISNIQSQKNNVTQYQKTSISTNSTIVTSSAPTIVLRNQDRSSHTNLLDQRPVLIPASHELIFQSSAGKRNSNLIAQKKLKEREVEFNDKIIFDPPQEFRSWNENLITGRVYTPVTLSALSVNSRPSIVIINKNEESTPQHKKIKTVKTLYGSVLVGSDINTVKMQPLSKPGITAGLKIGFQINKWALETGLLYDRKSYSSDGKYFDYKVYPNTTINKVSGTCNMFEWPIDVHYAFTPVAKHTFYISGGVSSYLMKKEDYTYDYDWYGQPYYVNKTYKNSSNNFFSILNISAGYQVKVGKSSSLRFEPYGKLPINGVGIGKLPLTSFGANFIISKNFLQH